MRQRIEACLHATWRDRGLSSTLLVPASWLYGWASRLRARRAARRRLWRAPIPVVVVGNILVGGTGKTPVVIAVCQALLARGWRPGVVSRGYGRAPSALPRLSSQSLDAALLGDEPCQIARDTGVPVAVHGDRPLAIQALLAAHPDVDVIVSDDGLQHTAMARDVEIIVEDARGLGNGRLLPAGPLREPPSRLQRADWLIHNGPGRASLPSAIRMDLAPRQVQHLASGRSMDWAAWLQAQSGRASSAAAGIGQPQRFFDMLRQAGAALDLTVPLPDHGTLGAAILQRLPAGPVLVTAKDAVKCGSGPDERLWAVHVQARFSDPGWLDALDARLRKPGPGTGRIALH